jgi:signal peptidase II
VTAASAAGDRRRRLDPGRLIVPATIAGIVILLDQLTKFAVAGWLGPGESTHRRELLDPILAFEYVENTGAAFGVLRGQTDVLILVALAIVAGLVVYYLRAVRPSIALAASLGLLAGGATGNLIDRLRLGYVIDYVAVGVWPNFNVADMAVTLGVLFLAWHALVDERVSEASGVAGVVGNGREA